MFLQSLALGMEEALLTYFRIMDYVIGSLATGSTDI